MDVGETPLIQQASNVAHPGRHHLTSDLQHPTHGAPMSSMSHLAPGVLVHTPERTVRVCTSHVIGSTGPACTPRTVVCLSDGTTRTTDVLTVAVHGPETLVQYAEQRARDDVHEVLGWVRGILSDTPAVPFVADEGHGAVLADGSAYSPSWRALSGGSEVWTVARNLDAGTLHTDAVEVYVETLDAGTLDAYLPDELGDMADGYSLTWEDGCLYLSGPADDDLPGGEPEDDGDHDPITPEGVWHADLDAAVHAERDEGDDEAEGVTVAEIDDLHRRIDLLTRDLHTARVHVSSARADLDHVMDERDTLRATIDEAREQRDAAIAVRRSLETRHARELAAVRAELDTVRRALGDVLGWQARILDDLYAVAEDGSGADVAAVVYDLLAAAGRPVPEPEDR